MHPCENASQASSYRKQMLGTAKMPAMARAKQPKRIAISSGNFNAEWT